VAKTACPGQDTRFWGPGDVFETTCAACGYEIEFFKDDAHRRCPNCGQRVLNPKLNLGCAQWCEHAKDCLGYDPKESLALAQGAEAAITDRLIEALKRESGRDKDRITRALAVLDRAEEILRKEDGSPRVVLAAAVLHAPAQAKQEKKGPAIALKIMKEIGLDAETIDTVSRIIAGLPDGQGIDTLEAKIVWDADWLVRFPSEYARLDQSEREKMIGQVFKTPTGREMARRMFL